LLQRRGVTLAPYERLEREGQITFPNGTTWKIEEQISPIAVQDEYYPYEMRTVYACTNIAGPDSFDFHVGMKAALKLKAQ